MKEVTKKMFIMKVIFQELSLGVPTVVRNVWGKESETFSILDTSEVTECIKSWILFY